MRILIISPLYPPDLGRLASYTKELAQHLAASHQVTIATYGNIPEEIPGVRIVYLSKTLPMWSRLFQFTRLVWREAKQADLLYVSDGASIGIPSLIAARLRQVPLVRFVMSDEAWERAVQSKTNTLSEEEFSLLPPTNQKDAWVRRLQRFVLKKATHIFVSTQARKDLLVNGQQIPPSQIHVLPYPLEKTEIIPFKAEPHPFRLLVTSPLMKNNGVAEVIRAVAQLSSIYEKIELIVASYGPEIDTLKNLAEENHVRQRIHFFGYVSHAEAHHLMRSSTALILNHESFHRPDEIYHAYAAHLPIIASDIPTHHELIKNGTSGILTPLGKTEDLIRAIKIIFEDQHLRTTLIEEGRYLVETRARWETHLAQLHQLFQEMIPRS